MSPGTRPLLNARLTDDEVAAQGAKAEVLALSGRMTSIETAAFVEVFEMLEEKQRSKAADAFPFMAGLFQPSSRPSMPSRGRGGE
jgi:hypothetical protein